MSNPRIALVTYDQLPNLDESDQPLVGAFAEVGIDALPVVWDDASVDWDSYDLVIVRSTWDYSGRRDEYVKWARSVPRLLNSADVIEWSTDKHYLKQLADTGVRIIPTLWLNPERHQNSQAIHTRLPAFGDYVIKPTISSGAQDTIRFRHASAQARGKAILHARELLRNGRDVMVQRYFSEVDTVGETCIIFISGKFSHAVRKNAMLRRDMEVASDTYQREEMSRTQASEEQMVLAQRTLIAAAASLGIQASDLLYARVDMIPDADGVPHLLELELAEPSLFFAQADKGATDRFVADVKRRLESAAE